MSEDERYIVVNGRRWRREDPGLPEEVAEELRSHLGRARSAIGRSTDADAVSRWRERVDAAKRGLGERGAAWWEQDDDERRRRWEHALEVLRDG